MLYLVYAGTSPAGVLLSPEIDLFTGKERQHVL